MPKQLRIQEDLDGLTVRFPGNGRPATSMAGKVFQTLFWVCCFSPAVFYEDAGMLEWGMFVVAALTLFLLGWQARKQSLKLSHELLWLLSPSRRRSYPLEEIDGVRTHADDSMGFHYVTFQHDGAEVTVDALLKKEDAIWLVDRIEAAIHRRQQQLTADDAPEIIEPPEALRQLLSTARQSE